MGYNLRKQKPRRNDPKVITPEILDEIVSSIPQNEDSTEPLVAFPPKVLSQDSKGSLPELPTNCHDPPAASFLRTTGFISRIAGDYPNIKTKVITYIEFIKRTKDSLKSKAC